MHEVCGSAVGVQGSWWRQIVGGSVVGGSAGRKLMVVGRLVVWCVERETGEGKRAWGGIRGEVGDD